MISYKIRITDEAEKDLVDLFEYIARKDIMENAYHVLDNIELLILSLEKNPQRGTLSTRIRCSR